MCFGTFDNFHPGHQNYLEQAAKFKLPLIVIVARDKTVKTVKGYLPQESEKIRLKKVNKTIKDNKIKGKAILGLLKDRWSLIKKYRPEVICLGYDQQVDLKALESVIAEERFFCKIKRLKAYYPEKYKSSYCRK